MGSILERTAAVIGRHFALFVVTTAIVIGIPIAVGIYTILGVQAAELQAMLHQLAAGEHSTAPSWPFFAPQFRRLIYGESLYLLGLLLEPVAFAAVAADVDAILRTGRVRLRFGFARVFVRLPQILGVLVLSILVDLGAMAAGILVIAGAVGAVIVAYRDATHSILLLSAVITIALFVLAAVAIAFVLIGMALYFALFAATVERKGVVSSVGSGFERIFARREWKRALLIALIAIVWFSVSPLAGSVLAGMVNLVPGGTAFAAALDALVFATVVAVGAVLYAVYYHDVCGREASTSLPASP